MELAQGGAGRCGAWIVDVMLNFITLELITYIGFSYYASATKTMFGLNINCIELGFYKLLRLLYTMFNMIGGLILVMSRLQAVVLRVWILGV